VKLGDVWFAAGERDVRRSRDPYLAMLCGAGCDRTKSGSSSSTTPESQPKYARICHQAEAGTCSSPRAIVRGGRWRRQSPLLAAELGAA